VKNDKKGNKSFENSEILWSNGEEEFFDKVSKLEKMIHLMAYLCGMSST